MRAWAIDQGLADRISVEPNWPNFESGGFGAAIVVNAAKDHVEAAGRALSAGVPVLVEKPMALSTGGAEQLLRLARENSASLATAHVFLFARYIDKFSTVIRQSGQVSRIRFRWEDPATEVRHGEAKRYDASLPAPADVLPHVVSILSALTPRTPIGVEHLIVRRGGAEVEFDLAVGDLPCSVQLIRNGVERCRIVEITASNGTLGLDFSREPGTISNASVVASGDPDWEVKRRPLAEMLSAFLRSLDGGVYDARLDPRIGVEACRVIDQAMPMYRKAQRSWLAARAAAGITAGDNEMDYARRELQAIRANLQGSEQPRN